MCPQLGPEAADKEGPAIPISSSVLSQGDGLPWTGPDKERVKRELQTTRGQEIVRTRPDDLIQR